MDIVGIIPARYGATRFPGKVLAILRGKPMIQHVYERVYETHRLKKVVVACDDERIYRVVKDFGGEVLLTSQEHKTGTDRVAEASEHVGGEIIVNIQADEPLIKSYMIDQLLAPMLDDMSLCMSTLAYRIYSLSEVEDPHTVKVVIDKDGHALYFSRSPLPYVTQENREYLCLCGSYFGHIGIYAYRRDFLHHITSLEETKLEGIEKLEQLRVLENGYKVRVSEVEEKLIGVDTPEDLKRVEELL